ncbi:PD-(D/E)XK nuclease family protein [Porphyromonadaceae bacterium]
MKKMENKRFDFLLKNIKNILRQNQKIEKLNGENFNLFILLDRERDEVKTHSAFISELLKPNGSHGMGNVFLRLFFNMLIQNNYLDNYNDDCIDETHIEVEKSVGNILDINSRLDIYISNRDFQICIENKIYAKDQTKQLERYKKFLVRNKSKKHLLIYLSLFGKEYGQSELKKDSEYICLSYKDEILSWLKECLKEAVDYPILRESIKQYIILIKSLTHQSMSNKMQEQIQKIILSDIESSEAIKNQYDKAIKDVTKELKIHIVKKLKASFVNKKYNVREQEWGQFSSIFISSSQKEFSIGIESFNGQGHYNGDLFIGAIDFDKKNKEINYVKGGWINGSIERIWDKKFLFQKLQDFANGNEQSRELIIDNIVKKIEEFVKRHWESDLNIK